MSLEQKIDALTAAVQANTAMLEQMLSGPLAAQQDNAPAEDESKAASSSKSRAKTETKKTETKEKRVHHFVNHDLQRVVYLVAGSTKKADAAIKELTDAENVEEVDASDYAVLKAKGYEEMSGTNAAADLTEEPPADEEPEQEEPEQEEDDGLGEEEEAPEQEITADDVKAALKKVRDEVGRQDLAKLFKDFGAKTFPDLKEEQYAEVHAAAMKALGK